jgi:hypothetical protein
MVQRWSSLCPLADLSEQWELVAEGNMIRKAFTGPATRRICYRAAFSMGLVRDAAQSQELLL